MHSDRTFFTNEQGRTLLDRFRRTLKANTKYFDVLVGYFRISGFYLLYDALENVDKIRILVGISVDRPLYNLLQKSQKEIVFSSFEIKEHMKNKIIEELENSEDLKEIEEGVLKFIEYVKNGKLEIRVYPKANIHAKVYIIRKNPEKSEDFGKVITGSSNFTQSGLIDNLEFNVELKNYSDVKFALDKFEELWQESIPLDERFVEEIKRKTWINDTLTPYDLYLKFLYEYLKDKINLDKETLSDDIDYPEDFKLLEYQKEAVIDAKNKIEQFGGVFLSDVVGLGKTYISVLLAKELGGRNLIIAPPHLVDYWESIFLDFGVPAKVVSSGKLDEILEYDHTKFKNIFIDEAHRFRNEDTQSYEKLHQLTQGKKVILISATPYNNRPKDIANLIFLFQKRKNSTIPTIRDLEYFFNSLESRLKNIDRIREREKYLKEVREVSRLMREKVLKYIMVRRTRKEIIEYFGDDLKKQGLTFPTVKEPKKVYYTFDKDLDDLFNETLKFIKNFGYVRYYPLNFLKKPLKENDPLLVSQKNLKGFMKTRLLKRLESSFEAFKNSLKNFISSYESFIEMYENGTIYISKQVNVYDYLENDREDELLELIEKGEKEVHVFKKEDFREEFKERLDKDLNSLKELYSKWEKISYDPKIQKLRQLIKNEKLNKKKVILFTEFIDTAEYLKKELKDILRDRLFVYSSKSKKEDRKKIEKNFDPNNKNQEDTIDFLITTDALAEGINLHRSNIIINYDIPWNPTKVLQRIGRVNRVGTKHENIYVYNFFPVSQIEENIGLEASALAKLQAFHHALGEDAKYLDPEVEEIDTHKLFNIVNSARRLAEGDEDEEDSQLKYLKELRKIRDENPELFNKIKKLPKKSKSSKKDKEKAVITLLKKGKLSKVFITKEDGITEELDFFDAVKLLKCSPEERREKIDEDFYYMLNKNKQEFLKIFMEEDIKKNRNPRSQTSKFIKHLKALLKFPGTDEEDKMFLKQVLRKAEEGAFPEKTLLKRLNKEIEKNILKRIDIIKDNIPDSYLRDKKQQKEEEKIEVVLSVYLKH